MKDYEVLLKSPVSTSFRCQKAADSLDINTSEKSVHHLKVSADINADYSIGLIIGASGSGKTTLAKQIFGEKVFESDLDQSLPIIEQFPSNLEYDDCAKLLSGVGLTSVPCWIRPVYTLSNGQKARAEIALNLAKNAELSVVDEWTSVVDRTVAKVMSYCVSKHIRASGKKIVLLSCHYDVLEWLDPDWVIDCNKQSYTDRRSLRRGQRKEKITFTVRRVGRDTWQRFSKYHYLSKNLPGGHIECFGLFYGDEQVGFTCFANYVPWRDKNKSKPMHSNRVVIHPDYAGFGLGIRFVNECSAIMENEGFAVYAKLSATPLVKARLKQPERWRLIKVGRDMKVRKTGNMSRSSGFRSKVKTYTFRYIAA